MATDTTKDVAYTLYNDTDYNYTLDTPQYTGGNDGRFPFGPPPMMPVDVLAPFKKYAVCITSVIGIIGNILVFYMFTRTKLKRPSTSRYLAATAFADTGYLLTVLLINVSRYYGVRIHSRVGMCQLITFGEHAFPFLIRWYLTAVVIEKYIGVMWPRKKSQMCTVFRAKCVVISLAIMSVVCYLYVTWFFVAFTMPPSCNIMWEDKRVHSSWIILTKMDAVINFAIPYILMFILMCLIAYISWQYRKRSRTASERFLRRRRITTPADKEFKTTPLLISLVVCTLLLCVPNSIMRLRQLAPDFQPSRTEAALLMSGLFHYFDVLNSAIKIFVYIVSSNSFARRLGATLCFVGRSFIRDHADHRNADVFFL